MSRPKTTRERKSRVPELSDRDLPFDAPLPPRPAPSGQPAAGALGPAIDHDALEALAGMDSAEFARLLDASGATSAVRVGDRVSGRVTRVGRDTVFVDLGAKSDGALERAEVPELKVGDTVTAYVVSTEDGAVQLSTRLSGAAAEIVVEEAAHSGQAVTGVVTGSSAGGLDVRIGAIRAFCPISHIERRRVEDPAEYVGRTLEFKVLEAGEKIVLSRRLLLDEQHKAASAALWDRVAVGDRLTGTVVSVQPFGAFVEVEGAQGLVPRQELSWAQVGDPASVVKVGQILTVEVLTVDREAAKLTLSARRAEDDPWSLVGSRFVEGATARGTVLRVEPYGAFVELTPGVTGLLHASRAGGSLPAAGDAITVRISGIDLERRRIELSSPDAAPAPDARAATVALTVQEVLRNGLVVALPDGATAWVPAREVDLDPGLALVQRFRRGQAVEGRPIGKDREGRPLFSLKEGEEAAATVRAHAQAPEGGFGTMADLLKGLDLGGKKRR